MNQHSRIQHVMSFWVLVDWVHGFLLGKMDILYIMFQEESVGFMGKKPMVKPVGDFPN